VRPRPVGTLCIVVHTHLPWLAHRGAWPVGEEWLHQAWAQSYLPTLDVLHRLRREGRTGLLTLGLTPVLAAQLDDPYCLREHHLWLGRWRLRAEELAGRPGAGPAGRETARQEFRAATEALSTFERHWRHGGSAALRPLLDARTVELLGGPATHPVLPLLPAPVARLALRAGLDDTAARTGRRPGGLWTPECAVSPDLPALLASEGVTHTLVDEPTLLAAGGSTDRVWLAGTVGVLGRDLELTDRVWSARSGYPRASEYRDFHAVDETSGFRGSAVTDPRHPDKRPYDPAAAARRVRRDAADFVAAVRDALARRAANGGRPLAVVAWDTELFGHWWHEGPQFLEQVLRMLPEAGVRLATLSEAVAEQRAGARQVRLPVGSWGAGKDLRLWSGEPVAVMAAEAAAVAARLTEVARWAHLSSGRDGPMDRLAREALLALSSDWAFMVSRDSAAEYGRERHDGHVAAFHRLADAVVDGADIPGDSGGNVVVPHLDARGLRQQAGDVANRPGHDGHRRVLDRSRER
jgi:1,4-alpha-glucan branching enzyme